jgi:tetratricopeptide (TPR) repeat protein
MLPRIGEEYLFRAYSELLQTHPEAGYLKYALAVLSHQKGWLEKAYQYYKSAAEYYLEKKMFREVIFIYRKMRQIKPLEIELYLTWFDLYLKSNLPEKACELLLEEASWLEAHALYKEAQALYQKALTLQADLEEAEKGLTRVNLFLERGVLALEELLFEARRARASGKLQEAEKHLNQILEVDKEYTEARYELALVYHQKGENKQALQELLILSQQEKDNPELLMRIASLYEREGEFEKAIESYQKALKQEPHYLPAHRNLERLKKQKAVLPKAEELFEEFEVEPLPRVEELRKKAISAPPAEEVGKVPVEKRVREFVLEAEIYLSHGLIEEGLKEYQKALEIQPENLEVLTKMANVYLKNGKETLALETCQRILKLDPKHSEANKLLSLIKQREEDKKPKPKEEKPPRPREEISAPPPPPPRKKISYL